LFDCFPIDWYSLVPFFLGLGSFWCFHLAALLSLVWDELGNFDNCCDSGVVAFNTGNGVAIRELLEFFSLGKDVVNLKGP
jgi:hypothetical protein